MADCKRKGLDDYECICQRGTFGDPYAGCQQGECLTDAECPDDRACIDYFCLNPCLTNSTCRAQDFCQVRRHVPVCGYNFDEPPKVCTQSTRNARSKTSIRRLVKVFHFFERSLEKKFVNLVFLLLPSHSKKIRLAFEVLFTESFLQFEKVKQR